MDAHQMIDPYELDQDYNAIYITPSLTSAQAAAIGQSQSTP